MFLSNGRLHGKKYELALRALPVNVTGNVRGNKSTKE
jgi:hypothetical protein